MSDTAVWTGMRELMRAEAMLRRAKDKGPAFSEFIWGILILAGLSGIYYTCNTLQNSYQTNVIKNIMETGMMYPDTLPFPAVVVLLEFLSFDVDQVIGRCRWKNSEMNCSKIFFKQRTQMGYCFIFNSLINPKCKEEAPNNLTIFITLKKKLMPDAPFPWTTGGSGRRSGLRIELIPHFSENIPKHLNKHDSFFIRAVDSDDWPARRGDHIKSVTLSYFIIDQVDIQAENAIKALPVIQRNCLFNDEVIQSKDYIDFKSHYAICRINCRLRQILKYCKCVPDHLIPKTRFKPCTATGYHCIAVKHDIIANYSFSIKDKDTFSLNGQCHCFTSCSIILIDTDVVTKQNEISNRTVIDFHYRKVATPKFQTLLSFSWADYMVYFGGISSTFVGTSIMSIWEGIFYIFMIISALFYKICKKILSW
ncbi:sodium channel protein Nach-like [Condylostylus longicornis]|uniref:sodium channel protein Nach-like n=1 Tax=Condylostylus longicornis TaxID=2530218 RepID=UPI00244E20F0|nr:sodium channel protein Nach-like [Condylostylus longicornis]